MQEKNKRLSATIPFLIVLVALAACGQDERTPEERVAETQQAVCVAAPSSSCQALDEFTPVLDTAATPTWGWRNLITEYAGLIKGNDITAALQQAVKDIAVPVPSSLNPNAPLNTQIFRPTVYIPAGNYVLSSTVKLEYGSGIAIVGADPATTTIKWIGPAASNSAVQTFTATTTPVQYFIDQSSNADMFRVIDVGSMKFSRLTLDGNTTARIGVQLIQSFCYGKFTPAERAECPNLWVLPTDTNNAPKYPVLAEGTAVTGIEFNDDVFTGMSYGVVESEHVELNDSQTTVILDSGLGLFAGTTDIPKYSVNGDRSSSSVDNQGDILIRRSKFHAIAQQAVSIYGSNAFNWFIAESEFVGCYQGIHVGSYGGVVAINNRFISNGLAGKPVTIDNVLGAATKNGMDIYLGGAYPQVVRGNYSSGSGLLPASRKFLRVGAVASVEISGNYVVTLPPPPLVNEPYPEAIITSAETQMTLFDNYFESARNGIYAVETLAPNSGSQQWSDGPRIVHGGNSFSLTSLAHCTATCDNVLASAPDAGSISAPCEFISPADLNVLYGGIANEIALGNGNCIAVGKDSCFTPSDSSAPIVSAAAQAAKDSLECQIPPAPQAVMRPVTNITSLGCPVLVPGACSDAINGWLSAANPPNKSLLFIPATGFYLDKTIEVPSGRDVVIAGDGAKSVLFWLTTDATKPDAAMFHLAAPAHATLRDFFGQLHAASVTRPGGILIESHDDIGGGLVFGDTLNVSFAKSAIDVLGLDNISVRAELSGGGSTERLLGVTGGGKASSGDSTQTKGVQMFAGGGGSLGSFIELKNWGKTVLVGVDNEQAFNGLVLDQSGYLSLANGRFLPKLQYPPESANFADQPNIVVRGTFRGRATFVGVSIDGAVSALGATSGASVLSLDNFFETSGASPLQPVETMSCPPPPSSTPTAANWLDCSYAEVLRPPSTSIPTDVTQIALQDATRCPGAPPNLTYCLAKVGNATDCGVKTFVNTMLADERAALAAVVVPESACAGTQVRLHRLTFHGIETSPSTFMGPAFRVQRN
jgi:hypothetical protein